MNPIQEVPQEICSEGDYNYITYIDTDSLYVHAYPILKKLHYNFDNLEEKEKEEKLENLSLECQDLINKQYNRLASEIFNIKSHKFGMKTEVIIKSAYFRKTRRYAQHIIKKEGIPTDEIEIKGLEFKKTNFPPVLKKFFGDILIEVLKGEKKQNIDLKIKKLKEDIIKGQIDFLEIGNPTSIKTFNKYLYKKPEKGEMFSILHKGAPASVKASYNYNDLLKYFKLNKNNDLISQGDKIYWLWLLDNPYKIENIAYLSFDIPKEIYTFIEKYVDRKKMFNTILYNKIESFYEDLGWKLFLNEYVEKFFKIEN